MSIHNGITDGTKMCASERVGNCFVLLCVMHTHLGKDLMANKMKQRKISLKRFIECLKLYLAYEHWVTEPHSRAQVRRFYKLLGELIKMIKQCFPGEERAGVGTYQKCMPLPKCPVTYKHRRPCTERDC
jgi:hypothetical protein